MKRLKSSNSFYAVILLSLLVIIVDFMNRLASDEVLQNKLLTILVLILIGFIGLSYLYKTYQKAKRKQSYERTTTIESLLAAYSNRPTDFELFVAGLYEQYGYHAQVTSRTNDGGKDIILRKNGKVYYVEVKLYKRENSIGREKIQKLHSAVVDGRVNGGIFVTTSHFTNTAIDYAARNKIELVDGKELVDLISKIHGKNS